LERELARRNNEVTKSRIYNLPGDFVAPFPAGKSENFFTGSLRHYDEESFGVYEEFLRQGMWIT
jgi:hypothetical protein